MNKAIEWLKWSLFRFINLLLRTIRPPHTNVQLIPDPPGTNNYIWAFCSTIGEVNACRPLLEQLSERSEKLVLLTDRTCYKESYLNIFPDAIVIELSGELNEYCELGKNLPPALLIVCEIPCSIHDAPCRLSYGLLRFVKKRGKPVYLVNGWLYGYPPSCRMDAIETALFRQSYAQMFDRLTVQTDDIKKKLIGIGVDSKRIAVTGNMKFDCVKNIAPKIDNLLSQSILNALYRQEKPILVAGCLVNHTEFLQLISIHQLLKKQHGELISIFAPRHPEYRDVMEKIDEIADKSNLVYRHRSKMEDSNISGIDFIILDTIGELKAFFYCADICYMGRNHNVLEPLSFNKPVFTIKGWEATYPSYPVYQIAVEKNLIHCSDTFDEMAIAMRLQLESPPTKRQEYIEQQLFEQKGATKRNLSWLNLTRSKL